MSKHCRQTPEVRRLVRRVQAALTPDLLQGDWREQTHPLSGHCAVATEALWLALTQRHPEQGPWKMRRVSWHERGKRLSHWWLVDERSGCILDATAAQFTPAQLRKIYAAGRPGGPAGVRRPQGPTGPAQGSKRAETVLARLAFTRPPRAR